MEDLDTPYFHFYKRHIQYFLDKDIDGLVANDYTEDAEVLAGEFHVFDRQRKDLDIGGAFIGGLCNGEKISRVISHHIFQQRAGRRVG